MRSVLLLLLAVVLVLAAGAVIEDTFANIKNSPAEQMVVFYHSSDPGSKRVLKVVRKVAKIIEEELDRPFQFKKCDGDREVNKREFQEAQFVKGTTYIFTSTPNEGIVKYSGPVDVKTLVKHIKTKYLPYDPNDVLEFENEHALYERMDNADNPRPIFVKFFERWCEHCRRLKEPFAISATYFKGRVDFMEVECSKNDETLAFCTANDVRSFPTLILFTGEKKIRFNEDMRHVVTFEKFFDQHVPVQREAEEEEAADGSSAAEEEEEAETRKVSKKKGKRGSKGGKKKGKKAKLLEEFEEGEEQQQQQQMAEEQQPAPIPDASKLALEERVAILEAELALLKKTVEQLSKRK